jgi:DNA adenine methylase
MKPFIKYRGGKAAEIHQFLDYFPEQFDTYIEPFVGGGAVYFYLEHEKNIINDINTKLMSLYKEIKEEYPKLRKQLDQLEEIYHQNQREYEENKQRAGAGEYVENKNEQLYYQLRNVFNYPDGEWLEGVIYYFINKTAYSGMIRYNKKGEYNVPFGRYKNFNTKLITEAHHQLLQKTQLFNTDYSHIFQMAKKEDFMFLDPPYDCTFNDYGNLEFENGFDEKEQIRLAEEFKRLKCKALMVIAKTELTVRLYKDYILTEYDKNYSVNIRNRFKNSAKHLIITNYINN